MSNIKSEMAVTAIVTRIHWGVREFLLLKRAAHKKRWPNQWTLPGGHVEEQDWRPFEPNSEGITYNVIENALRREVFEEAGIYIRNIGFLTSMIFENGGTVVLSLTAEKAGDHDVVINDESSDWGWYTSREAEKLHLIDGILDELKLYEERNPR